MLRVSATIHRMNDGVPVSHQPVSLCLPVHTPKKKGVAILLCHSTATVQAFKSDITSTI